jgi:hypothetical protein
LTAYWRCQATSPAAGFHIVEGWPKRGPFDREIVRRLRTSAAQLYRLLDQTNYRKSVDQVLALLQVLNCDVDLVVRTKTA